MAVRMVGCENIFGLINLRNFHSPEVTLEPELSSLTGYHQLRKFVLISFSVKIKKNTLITSKPQEIMIKKRETHLGYIVKNQILLLIKVSWPKEKLELVFLRL